MKQRLNLILLIFLPLLFFYCGNRSNEFLLGEATGQGGPFLSPTDSNAASSEGATPASLPAEDEVVPPGTVENKEPGEDDEEPLAAGEEDNDEIITDVDIDETVEDDDGTTPAENDNQVNNKKKNLFDQGEERHCPAREITIDTSQGRWSQTPEKIDSQGKKIKGIHTAWANEKLLLKVKNNCQAGWYRLRIAARNIHGPLPEFYSHFNIQVKDDLSGDFLGGLNIKASDDKYHARGRLIYLNEGDTIYQLLWSNDAYLKNEYDANIQIKKVKLKYKRFIRLNKKMKRRADQYCQLEGRWFWNNKTAYTHWANQSIEFCYPSLPAGKYQVSIRAKNRGTLPPAYENFKVDVSASGSKTEALVRASETAFKTGRAFLDLPGGDTRLRLTWRNDKYKKGEYDANIVIKSIHLKRVGESERSALSGFIGKAASGQGLALILLAVGSAGLFIIFLLKRRLRN